MKEKGKVRRRLNIRVILNDPEKRQKLFVKVIISTQAVEGIVTTPAQALEAYRKAQQEGKK